MPTIEEFAGKAAMKGKTISFETEGINFRLVRIDDRLYYRAHEQSVNIQEDYGLYLELWALDRNSDRSLGLVETYAALSQLFGESSESYNAGSSARCNASSSFTVISADAFSIGTTRPKRLFAKLSKKPRRGSNSRRHWLKCEYEQSRKQRRRLA
jgi:hypothetical protein